MADNVILNQGAGGDTVAADEIGGIKHQRVKLQYGADGSATDVAAGTPLPVTSPGLEIVRGGYSNWSVVHKFGRNPDIDTVAAEDVWDGGGIWVPPTAARTHQVASTDTDDAAAGTGARTVQIYGLDVNYDLIDETVTMNGVTNVATANQYTMIHRMVVRSAGSLEQNDGDITATADTDGTVTAQISAGINQTLMAIYMVPDGFTAMMVDHYFAINRATTTGAADIKILIKPFGEVFQVKHLHGLVGSGTSYVQHAFEYPMTFSAKSIVKVQSEVTSSNSDITAGFDLVLVPDNEWAPG